MLVPSDNMAPSVRGAMIAETLIPQRRIPITTKGEWSEDAQMLIRHRLPLPLTVLSFTFKNAIGD